MLCCWLHCPVQLGWAWWLNGLVAALAAYGFWLPFCLSLCPVMVRCQLALAGFLQWRSACINCLGGEQRQVRLCWEADIAHKRVHNCCATWEAGQNGNRLDSMQGGRPGCKAKRASVS